MDNKKYKDKFTHDYTGAVAIAFLMANLLFIGVFFIVLWGLYFISYKNASQVSKNHIKQALWVSTMTTSIALALAIIAFLTTGFASVQALIMAEVYLMAVVPLFMFFGVMAFAKAINEKDFKFPIIGSLLGIEK
jgi:cytochrome bd-type quinol oxidase subunit 2